MYKGKPLKWKEVECQYPELGMCWEVTSHEPDENGYIRIGKDGGQVRVHRFIYEELFGFIPDGMIIMHKCDNRKCINPEHLKLGTHQDNMDDMVGKGRAKVKLNEEDVRAIRADKRSYSKIAIDYGVGFSTIGAIKRGEIWKNII